MVAKTALFTRQVLGRALVAACREPVVYAAALLCFSGIGSAPALADGYRLGPQDKLRIRVLEWIAAKGTYQTWEALDGDYTVSEAGTISMPLLGAVPAAGKSAEELGSEVGLLMQKTTGLQTAPVASVEVSQFRPVYVSGAVSKPGEYPWRPGMDVTKAISLAGGRQRPFETSQRPERDVITQMGVITSIDLEIVRMLARRARLSAEAADAADIAFPQPITSHATGSQIMAEERAILGSRREKLARQVAAIDALKSLLQTEIDTLGAKTHVLERQLESSKSELASVTGLVKQGIAPANRQFEMDRVLGNIQAQQLDLATSLVRARQGIANAERDKIALVEDQRLQVARDIQDTQASIDQLGERRLTAERLVFEASSIAARGSIEAFLNQQSNFKMTIARTVEGKTVRLTASADTPVMADDVVEIVEMPPVEASVGAITTQPFEVPAAPALDDQTAVAGAQE
ncbi:polysaccharide biosynthesis/export family protein [Tianweitania sp.]|uniref:polysaccharide biosynthesis/export family protein n=1 Tax=Tianweitania sp. TaxID=2021634 RepID=UPI002899B818|nr:polysaccharide biosynthesis/export family protein [Tianweitania sp.]